MDPANGVSWIGSGAMSASVRAAYELSGLFWLSWLVAAAWSRRSASRPVFGSQTLYTVLFLIGFGMLMASNSMSGHAPFPLDWILVAVMAGGFAFCWWARLHLGSLWSGTVMTKEGHHVVDTGPYRLVRHPIYTGLIISGFGLAVLKVDPLRFLGAAIWTLSVWIKARREERFLRAELGEAAYDAYAARTPMLIPFLPK